MVKILLYRGIAIPSFLFYLKAWATYSKELLEAFLKCGGKTVVVSGTCFEYDFSKNLPLKESFQGEPNTPYGKAKLKTERIYEHLCKEICG